MSAVPLSQKLVVLCMLHRCQHPLTGEQIDIYMVENNWSDYMLVQQLKYELHEAHFVTVSDSAPYFYMLTPRGRDALAMFIGRMPPYLRNQVEAFVVKNRDRMLQESTVFIDVQPKDDISYRATVRLYEGQNLVMDLSVMLPRKDEAQVLAQNLKQNAYTLRDKIMRMGASVSTEF